MCVLHLCVYYVCVYMYIYMYNGAWGVALVFLASMCLGLITWQWIMYRGFTPASPSV